jgi:iron complex outermembrane receptor protein
VKNLVLLLASAAFASPALAQQAPAAPPPVAHDESQEIVVTAPFVEELDLLAGTSVLTGTDLLLNIRPQIGDSLTRLPGVSATSFTPGASRPVLRGFQGERIRVLTDGIGSIDVSNTSADHAVTIDPLTAERIEVLRGPAVLLFGSQAIGGAVNVIDRRIPRTVPEKGVHLDLTGVLGSAARERSIGGAVDVAVGTSGLVLHADGSFRKTGDLRVGSYVLSPSLRAEQFAIAEEETEEGHLEEAAEALELAEQRGRLPNSATRQKTAGAGVALIRDAFNIGASVSWFNSDYGVPSRPGAGHGHGEEGEEGSEEEAHGEEPVTIGLEQVRFDLRGELKLASGFLETIRLRAGTANYEHTEFEGDEVGTVFKSDGLEGRLELVQRKRDGWRGATGVQFLKRDFDAIGAEAFVPRNKTRQVGLFTLQEFDLGKIGLEAAARFERTDVKAVPLRIERDFSAFSGAVGASYEVAPNTKIGLNLSRSARAPAGEELFSNGPHIATQSFEVGNPDLKVERSLGGEAFVRVRRSGVTLSATAFTNRFNGFIYQDATGEEEDGLPVFQYFQRDARHSGFELEASAPIARVGGFQIVADGVADYVRVNLKGNGPAPRIPPLRLLGALEAQSAKLDGRVEVEWTADQNRTAAFETATDGHTLFNASLAWRPWGRSRETSVILSANNIFDVDARRHASFTKDFVRLAGRDIRLSTRFSF